VPSGELREQPAFAGEVQTAGAGPPGQAGDQLLVDHVQTVTARGLVTDELVQVQGRCSGTASVIRCHLHDRSYTVVSTVPGLTGSRRV
jgi:hypothetical protein